MKIINAVYTVIFLFVICFIFRNWFFASEIIGGDWPYYYKEMLKAFHFFPLAWNPQGNRGLGGLDPIYALSIFHNFTISFSVITGLSWVLIYKIFWFVNDNKFYAG